MLKRLILVKKLYKFFQFNSLFQKCNYIILSKNMPERKTWSPLEDQTLKYLRDQAKITKWSIIAKRMTQQYGMDSRTGKQCRERYHNHLDSTILRNQWDSDQQKHLYQLHDEIGNKWAIIAEKLPGRTDNCVKNHFYSKMRKAIRKLNKIIHTYYKRDIKQIKLNILYKLVQATDQKFKISPSIDQQISDQCSYANQEDDQQTQDIQYLKQLAISIHQISSKYRKKPKRSRRHSAHAPDIITLGKIAAKYKSNSQNQYESQDDFESHDQHEDSLYLGFLSSSKKLQSVKEEEDGWKFSQPVPTYSQTNNYEMKPVEQLFKPNNFQSIDNDFLSLQEQNQNKEQRYVMEEQVAEREYMEDMLSDKIESMKIHGDLGYEQIEIDDKDQII